MMINVFFFLVLYVSDLLVRANKISQRLVERCCSVVEVHGENLLWFCDAIFAFFVVAFVAFLFVFLLILLALCSGWCFARKALHRCWDLELSS